MPRPNKLQWIIMWVTVLLAAHFWIGATAHVLWHPDDYGGWGLPAYFGSVRPYREKPKYAVTILVIGGLLVWMAAGKRGSRT